ncbi:MAG: MATE family efflux transporter [Gammaproteobacteria bacterium]|nr:MATE family efflux transporter [Gammaproteobacteria bacterium]
MIPRRRLNKILALALPIIGGMTSQNILNLVDTAFVGRLGDAALAAVGLGGFANFMAIAFITGLSSGVQAIAARRKGEGNTTEMAVGLNGGLLLALGIGVPLTIILFLAAPFLFPLLNGDPAVVELGVPYWQARLAGMIFVGMNFCFRGYWNGVNQSGYYMRTLLMMHALNIFFNYALIFGNFGFPELGATGAGIGTSLALVFGTAYYFYLGFKHARPNGFLIGVPSREQFANMLKLAVPSSIQTFFFAAGLTAMYWIIGQVGTRELAAANVLVNIMLVCILPAIGLGLAAASLAGQALGAKNPADAKQWGWDVSLVGFVFLALLGAPMWLATDSVLSVFVTDPETIAVASLPLKMVGWFIAFDGVGLILMNALLGVGAAKVVMKASIGFQWGLFLPVAWIVGPWLGGGLIAVWIAQFGYRALQAILFGHLWQKAEWQHIKV